VLVGGVTVLSTHDHRSAAPADQTTFPFAYAVGSVIHSGDDQIDVGVHVESMVQTARGFVFADPRQRVYEERNGHTRQIGRLASRPSHLVVGDDGRLVGWWDGERFQLWTGPTGKTDSVDVGKLGNDPPPSVRAIADSHVWFWNGGQTWAADKPSSDDVYRVTGFDGSDTIQDAAAGKMLVQVGEPGDPSGLAVIDEVTRDHPSAPSGLAPQVRNIGTGDLSPDARHWFTDDRDQFAVFDSATGQRQDPAHPGFEFAAPYQWLDNDSMAVLAVPNASRMDHISLLTCRVSTNACTVTASDIGRYRDVAIPDGAALGD
jgi:hypothetical protein